MKEDNRPLPDKITAEMAFIAAAADEASRTVSGVIVEYGAIGNASTGPTTFLEGSISVPEDLSRVKLLEMHDQERSIGHLAEVHDDNGVLRGKYNIAPGAAGDTAIQGIKNKTRDAFSLGAAITDYEWSNDGDTLIVKAAKLLETSLVTIPAFENSRVEDLAAQHGRAQTMPEVEEQQSNEPPKVEAGNLEQAPKAPVKIDAAESLGHIFRTSDNLNLDQLADRILAGFGSGLDAGAVQSQVLAKLNPKMFTTAALTDVVPADDAGQATDTTRPQWIDELWQARRIERPTIDSLDKQRLTSLKIKGYRLNFPDGTGTPAHMVNEYDGSKADVPPSAKLTTTPAETDAKRWAGGWDIDRAYFDFNDRGFIRATIQAAFDDYLAQTEADVVAAVIAAATPVTGADILEVLAEIGAQAAGIGAGLTKVQFAPDMWKAFIGLSATEVPWWLQKQGNVNLGTVSGNAGEISFNVNVNIPAGTIEAHDRRAATFYESPFINVQALNIPKGGVDLGVFGYTGIIINDPRALIKGTVVTAP